MDRRLNNRIIDVLCEEWSKKSPTALLESKTVYDRLVEEGEQVPDYAMDQLLSTLHKTGAISGSAVHDREAARTYGGWYISGVGPIC